MNSTKRARALALLLLPAALLGMTACSNPDAGKGSEKSDSAPAEALPEAEMSTEANELIPDEIRSKGKIVAAMDTGAPPMHYVEAGSDDVVGLDADLAVALGQALGVEVVVQPTTFDGIIPGIAADKFDLSIAQMSPTAERMEVLDFVTYAQAGDALGVAAGNPEDLSIDSLCGHKVGALKGSWQQLEVVPGLDEACAAAGEPALDVSTYPDMQGPVLALQANRIEAFLIDGPAGNYAANESDQLEVAEEVNVGIVGIGSKKGNGLDAAVQAALESLKEQGVYEAAFEHWGLSANMVDEFTINVEA
ncbi:transporter substrate-binding domain-containing protein [Leucobacter sp. CSA1]|uniref:Transporter substrate-binding domain-containing protein n=1 Tax=Leucobacter chromiisoli TaxID=2796471 RepID=A0A934Q9E4_9MICO|nr:transporter substrate-binding domain-containing protein [Leucobacter chromiisoli]MBK0419566.1 transporter substrate-binding domain-containing protein [Leucobacter chromiisoli]